MLTRYLRCDSLFMMCATFLLSICKPPQAHEMVKIVGDVNIGVCALAAVHVVRAMISAYM
jgi:hypothetical protein